MKEIFSEFADKGPRSLLWIVVALVICVGITIGAAFIAEPILAAAAGITTIVHGCLLFGRLTENRGTTQ